MKLEIIIEGHRYFLDVPQDMLDEGGDFFNKMDRDMDKGCQIGREFVENPDKQERIRLVANRILTAMENEDRTMALLMAAYVLTREPDIAAIDVDTSGEMESEIHLQNTARPAVSVMSPAEAMKQTEKDVSRVYKVGKVFRFSTYNHIKKEWIESEAFPSEDMAKDARLQALNVRYAELTGQ